MKQATNLICKTTFSFKVNGKGRAITFRQGQVYWITNSELDQKARGIVNVATVRQKHGYDFTGEQVDQFFGVE